MGISFKCECCEKKIKAPDSAGGKWGACPSCNHRCYIPLPHTDGEDELLLAPIDPNEESQYQDMMKATHDLTKKVLNETTMPDDDGSDEPFNERQLLKNIIVYLRYVAEGKLENAESAIPKISAHKERAQDLLKRMARAEKTESELQDINPKLLLGLMKNLNAKLV
jgi:hypothetical protein